MLDALQPFYPWIKAGHVIAMVAWMALAASETRATVTVCAW